jgi:hypothetical protein
MREWLITITEHAILVIGTMALVIVLLTDQLSEGASHDGCDLRGVAG